MDLFVLVMDTKEDRGGACGVITAKDQITAERHVGDYMGNPQTGSQENRVMVVAIKPQMKN